MPLPYRTLLFLYFDYTVVSLCCCVGGKHTPFSVVAADALSRDGCGGWQYSVKSDNGDCYWLVLGEVSFFRSGHADQSVSREKKWSKSCPENTCRKLSKLSPPALGWLYFIYAIQTTNIITKDREKNTSCGGKTKPKPIEKGWQQTNVTEQNSTNFPTKPHTRRNKQPPYKSSSYANVFLSRFQNDEIYTQALKAKKG